MKSFEAPLASSFASLGMRLPRVSSLAYPT